MVCEFFYSISTEFIPSLQSKIIVLLTFKKYIFTDLARIFTIYQASNFLTILAETLC